MTAYLLPIAPNWSTQDRNKAYIEGNLRGQPCISDVPKFTTQLLLPRLFILRPGCMPFTKPLRSLEL